MKKIGLILGMILAAGSCWAYQNGGVIASVTGATKTPSSNIWTLDGTTTEVTVTAYLIAREHVWYAFFNGAKVKSVNLKSAGAGNYYTYGGNRYTYSVSYTLALNEIKSSNTVYFQQVDANYNSDLLYNTNTVMIKTSDAWDAMIAELNADCYTFISPSVHASRYTKYVWARTNSGNAMFSGVIQSGAKQEIYHDKRDMVLKAMAGDTVTMGVEYIGEWMMGSVWVDKDRDGKFPETELVDRDSTGDATFKDTYIFWIPDTMPIGSYGLRYITGWQHVNGCSDAGSDGGTLAQNGGCAVDFILEVVDNRVDTIYLEVHDTTYIDKNVYVHDTTYINVPVYIHDTTYVDVLVEVHDTMYIDTPVYVHDTTYVDKEVYLHDTLYLDNNIYIHDTTYVDKPIYIHDTLYLDKNIYVHDTTYLYRDVYIHDTLYQDKNVYIHDTTYISVPVEVYVYDTLYLDRNHYFHDTTYVDKPVYVHDTIRTVEVEYVYETVYVDKPIAVHDTIYLACDNSKLEEVISLETDGIVYANNRIVNTYKVEIYLYDAVGRYICKRKEDIDMSGYTAGVYLLYYNGKVMKIAKW